MSAERGDWGRAIETCESAIEYGAKGGFVAGRIALGSLLGLICAMVGAHDRARARHAAVLDLARGGLPAWYAWPAADAARAAVRRGDLDAAGSLLAEVAAETGKSGRAYLGVELAMARSEHALATGDAQSAIRLARAGAAQARGRAILPLLKDFDLAEAAASLRLGDRGAARAAAERGIAASREQGSVRVLWELLGVLAAVSDAEGRADEARRAREEAAVIVDRIAASLRSAALDDSFRATDAVRVATGRKEARA